LSLDSKIVRWALGATVATIAIAAVIGTLLVRASAGEGRSTLLVSRVDGEKTDCLQTRVVREDRASLNPIGKRVVRVTGAFEQPVFSPDRKRVALGGDGGELIVVDADRLKLTRTVRVAPPGNDVRVAAWPSSERIVAITYTGRAPTAYTARVAVIDVNGGRVIATTRFRDQDVDWRSGRTQSGLVPLLVVSRKRLRAPRLLIVAGDGGTRTVVLDRLRAGFHPKHGDRVPGFAVDPTGERAYVLEADLPVAIVDLRTSSVRYRKLAALDVGPPRAPHPPGPPPPTERRRQAVWLGDGRIGISGSDSYVSSFNPTSWQTNSMRPTGLMILDTRTWDVETLDERPVDFEWLGERLVASGRTLPHERRDDPMLIAFDRAGRPAYTIRGNRDMYWQTFDSRIFVSSPGRDLEVRDSRDGRVLGRVPAERLVMGPC
jgi:hypothetical protein